MKSVPGKIVNESEMVLALKARGFYSSGVPRQAERKPKVRRLSKRDLRAMSEVEFQQYINDREEYLK